MELNNEIPPDLATPGIGLANGVTPVSEEGVPEEEPEPKIELKDSLGLKSGKYSKKHIEGIIKASKEVGIDPYQAIALALQESGIGTARLKMRRGSIQAPFAMVHDFEPAQQKELEEKSKKTGISEDYLKLAIVLRDKLKYGKQLGFKDEASQLQAYNGYGVIKKHNFGGGNKAYGVEIGDGIDMKKNPLYGKRLVGLKNDIKNNKEVLEIYNSIYGTKPSLGLANNPASVKPL